MNSIKFTIVRQSDNLTGIENALVNFNNIFDTNYQKMDYWVEYLKSIELVVNIPKTILEKLFLEKYHSYFPNENIELINKALILLDKYEQWKNKYCLYLKSICFLETESNFKGRKITSLTLPTFPFCSFFSENAFIHLPPTIFKEKSHLPLSENILHEAVHQFVSISIIENKIFIKDFDTKKSPKVPISWRKNDIEERNRSWELDRCIHAFYVYAEVYKYRKFINKEIHVSYYDEIDIMSSKNNRNYLGSNLVKFQDYFKKDALSDINKIMDEE